jgi:hypothetical protein
MNPASSQIRFPLGASMDNKQFKAIFNQIASANGFLYKHSAWFKESNDCIVVLSLQKSNYSQLFYLNIKTYLKGVFGRRDTISKDLLKDVGDIFRRQPKEFEKLFDLESNLSIEERQEGLTAMFESFTNRYTNVMLSKDQIIHEHLQGSNEFSLLPAVRKELGVA